MVVIQMKPFLPQLVRLKKVEEFALELPTMVKTLSKCESAALRNAFETNIIKVNEEKQGPWV